jgi:hypothetical protein
MSAGLYMLVRADVFLEWVEGFAEIWGRIIFLVYGICSM